MNLRPAWCTQVSGQPRLHIESVSENLKRKHNFVSGGVAQLVEFLTCMEEAMNKALSLISSTGKSFGVVTHFPYLTLG